MMNVFRNIDHNRFRVDFLLFSWGETEYSKEVEAAGCKVWRVTCRRESPIGWYTSLYHFFKEHAKEYTAIHYNGNGLTAIAPIVLAFLFKIPIRIVHAHNSSASGFHNKYLHILLRSFVRRITTHHFACSTAAAEWFYGSHPAVVIKNGIDTNKFAYNPHVRQSIRSSLGISQNAIIIGHVGRFEEEKNHSFILEIFSAFIKGHPNAVLLLIGVGSLLEKTKEQVQQLGIEKNVHFLGERKDVNLLLQAIDCFLMPSTFEGQPFVLIEAQCAGVPCLVSDAINEDICLTDNVVRYQLARSSNDWASEMERLLDNFQRKDESSTIAEKGYSIKSVITYLEKVYGAEDSFK